MKSYEFIKESNYYINSKFADDSGTEWQVERVVDFAKQNPEYLKKDFPLDKIKHDLSWWENNPEQHKRMLNADTKYPLLVVQSEDGSLSVADGLNRMKKAIEVEDKDTLDVYLVPLKDIQHLAIK